jgi:hypothetical protein
VLVGDVRSGRGGGGLRTSRTVLVKTPGEQTPKPLLLPIRFVTAPLPPPPPFFHRPPTHPGEQTLKPLPLLRACASASRSTTLLPSTDATSRVEAHAAAIARSCHTDLISDSDTSVKVLLNDGSHHERAQLLHLEFKRANGTPAPWPKRATRTATSKCPPILQVATASRTFTTLSRSSESRNRVFRCLLPSMALCAASKNPLLLRLPQSQGRLPT